MSNKGIIIALVIILALLFVYLYSVSARGWGYSGYYGYRYGPSFWYWGGPRYYPAAHARGGSLGGPRHLGGGPHGGK